MDPLSLHCQYIDPRMTSTTDLATTFNMLNLTCLFSELKVEPILSQYMEKFTSFSIPTTAYHTAFPSNKVRRNCVYKDIYFRYDSTSHYTMACSPCTKNIGKIVQNPLLISIQGLVISPRLPGWQI